MAQEPEYTTRWTKFPDESWGVLVEGPKADKLKGMLIDVTNRFGKTREVELLELVQSWDKGAKATYTVPARKKNDPPPQKPRGTVEVNITDLQTLMEKGKVTVAGVTLVFSK